mgnify:CR=1 FL=1
MDPQTDRLLRDGAKVHKGMSKFLRAAILNYWGLGEEPPKNEQK